MKRRDKILCLALGDNVPINDGTHHEKSPMISQQQDDPREFLLTIERQMDILHSPPDREIIEESPSHMRPHHLSRLVSQQLSVESPLAVLQLEVRCESPLTDHQKLVAAEMENLNVSEDMLDFNEQNVRDVPLFLHLGPLSVFTMVDLGDDEQRQPEDESELSPLFTPIQSVQPMSSPSIIGPSNPISNITENIFIKRDADLDNDDDYVPDGSNVPLEIENQPSPGSPIATSSRVQDEPLLSRSDPQQSLQIDAPSSVDTDIIHQEESFTQVVIRNKRKTLENWKSITRKRNRNNGLEYTAATGNVKPARKCKTINASCKCKQACHTQLDNETRKKLFESYWALSSIERQRDFIGKNVTTTDATKSRVPNSRRKFTFHYSFAVNNKIINVCQPFFLATLDVSEKVVRTAMKKTRNGVGQIQSPDKRGRHPPGIKYADGRLNFADKHIDSFPAVPSHWCRKDTKKIYLESILNKEKMYELYKVHCLEHNKQSICKTAYKELILKKNIDFQKPKKDLCWCHKFEDLPEQEQISRMEEFEEHVNRKEYANATKASDKNRAKEDKTIHVCTFDFEAVLYCPLVLGKPVFYKRKLGNMNFTVHNAVTKQGFCYFWPEYEGNRGANEVSTCLYDYITQLRNVEHLVLYSDCCPGQNRNSVVLTMLSYIIISPDNNIKTIDYKYLEPGHTYMECDNMHSTIERASEYTKIFIPEDWVNVVRLARKDSPYKIKVMNHKEFLNFKTMRETLFPVKMKSTDGTILKWADVRLLQLKKDVPGSFFFKHDYWEEFKEVKLKNNRPGTRRSENSESCIPTKLYTEQILLKAIKHKDIMAMCRDGTIPQIYHSYYQNLPVLRNENITEVINSDNEDELALTATKQAYMKRRPRRKN